MSLKQIFVPHLNHHVKMGRKAPTTRATRLHFSDYFKGALPTPPASTNYRASATNALSQMYHNDTWGDCVIAGSYHRIGLLTGVAGNEYIAPSTAIQKDYTDICGFNLSDPSSDAGCDMQTAANYRVTTGYADGSKDAGWISINAADKNEVAVAMWLFENLDFGVALPDAWVNPFPSGPGFTWDVQGDSDPENGHCFEGVDLATNGIVISTWGMTGTITWAAIAKYAADASGGELYVHLSPDQLAKGQAKLPSGLDWAQLVADFDSMGGKVPAPVAPVTPTPTPAPAPAAPTLVEATTWATADLKTFKGPSLSSKTAIAKVTTSLAKHWPK